MQHYPETQNTISEEIPGMHEAVLGLPNSLQDRYSALNSNSHILNGNNANKLSCGLFFFL